MFWLAPLVDRAPLDRPKRRSASLKNHKASTLALGVSVVTNQTNMVIGIGPMTCLEFVDNHPKIFLTEKGKFPVGPIGCHRTAGMDVLNQRTPTLGDDVSNLVVDFVLSERRQETKCFQGGDCLIVTHRAFERHGGKGCRWAASTPDPAGVLEAPGGPAVQGITARRACRRCRTQT
jgi:hypothetical protein